MSRRHGIGLFSRERPSEQHHLAIVLCSLVRVPWRALAWVLAVALPIFVAVSRLCRGMHFLTDVAADAARFDLSALRPRSLQNAEQR